jgi:thiol-disulfide isomerase/thioredoxin
MLLRTLCLSMLIGFNVTGCAQSDSVDFSLEDLEGRQRSLSEFRGKWVIVNYWATWCPPCLEEMPELEVFHSNHKDENAVVLGVNMEDVSVERLREFVDSQFISFPILRDRPRGRTELGDVPGLPTTFMVTPDGKLAARQVGPVTIESLEQFISNYHPSQGAVREDR